MEDNEGVEVTSEYEGEGERDAGSQHSRSSAGCHQARLLNFTNAFHGEQSSSPRKTSRRTYTDDEPTSTPVKVRRLSPTRQPNDTRSVESSSPEPRHHRLMADGTNTPFVFTFSRPWTLKSKDDRVLETYDSQSDIENDNNKGHKKNGRSNFTSNAGVYSHTHTVKATNDNEDSGACEVDEVVFLDPLSFPLLSSPPQTRAAPPGSALFEMLCCSRESKPASIEIRNNNVTDFRESEAKSIDTPTTTTCGTDTEVRRKPVSKCAWNLDNRPSLEDVIDTTSKYLERLAVPVCRLETQMACAAHDNDRYMTIASLVHMLHPTPKPNLEILLYDGPKVLQATLENLILTTQQKYNHTQSEQDATLAEVKSVKAAMLKVESVAKENDQRTLHLKDKLRQLKASMNSSVTDLTCRIQNRERGLDQAQERLEELVRRCAEKELHTQQSHLRNEKLKEQLDELQREHELCMQGLRDRKDKLENLKQNFALKIVMLTCQLRELEVYGKCQVETDNLPKQLLQAEDIINEASLKMESLHKKLGNLGDKMSHCLDGKESQSDPPRVRHRRQPRHRRQSAPWLSPINQELPEDWPPDLPPRYLYHPAYPPTP